METTEIEKHQKQASQPNNVSVHSPRCSSDLSDWQSGRCVVAMPQSRKTPLLRFAEARKEYLDLNVMAGLTEESESFKKISDDTSSSIQTHIRALAGITPQDANLVISKNLEMRLLAGHKQDIVGAINDLVWLAYHDHGERRFSEPTLRHTSTLPGCQQLGLCSQPSQQ